MQFTRRAGLVGVAVSLASPAFAQRRSREPRDAQRSRDTHGDILVGAPNALSGAFAELGTRGVWGMQIAIDEINRAGGVKALQGARLRLASADTSSNDPARAAATARQLIESGAVALLGAGAGTMTLAVQGEAEQAAVPLVTSAYADGIVTRGFRYSFKIAPQGGGIWNWTLSAGVALLKDARGRAPRSALVVMGDDAVGTLLQKQLPAHGRTLGLSIAAQAYPSNLSDASALVMAVQRAKPDMMVLGGFANDVATIVKALRGAGVGTPIFGAGLMGTDTIGKALGAQADRLFTPMAWNWDLAAAGNREFVAAYKAAHPNEPHPPASEQLGQGYVAMQILRQALEASGSRDPKRLRDALADGEFTALPYPNPTVRFGDNGLNAHNTVVLAEWIRGELRTVWPKEQQTTAPVL